MKRDDLRLERHHNSPDAHVDTDSQMHHGNGSDGSEHRDEGLTLAEAQLLSFFLMFD